MSIDCQSVSALCPVETSIYGYYPNLGANLFFAVFFGICTILQMAQGFYWKSWSFSVPLALGCLSECIGYVGRILLHSNPFSNTGFEMQICCLILAPAFIAASIYLTLRYLVNAIAPQYSPIQSKWYPWIFISCDFLSLVLQAAGGATAATSSGDQTTADAGGHVMLSGIVFQVFTLLVFAGLVGEYFRRIYSNRFNLDGAAQAILSSVHIKLFMMAVLVAFTTIFARCVFRIAELAGGWSSAIMQNEIEFIVLDGIMCTVATLFLTVFPAGYFFPQMTNTQSSKIERNAAAKSVSESDLEK